MSKLYFKIVSYLKKLKKKNMINVKMPKSVIKGACQKYPKGGAKNGGASLNKISIFELQTPDFAWKFVWMNS